MTMRFAYVELSAPAPVVTLDGRLGRPYPIVPVSLIGPAATVARDGLVDPGADETVFPERDAIHAGIDLSQAPTTTHAGVGGVPVPVRFVKVKVRITDGQEFHEWITWVGFTAAALKRPLLGFAGFLRFFTTTFHGDREVVELTTNTLFPGPPPPAAGP
jgi:hypothetical protein